MARVIHSLAIDSKLTSLLIDFCLQLQEQPFRRCLPILIAACDQPVEKVLWALEQEPWLISEGYFLAALYWICKMNGQGKNLPDWEVFSKQLLSNMAEELQQTDQLRHVVVAQAFRKSFEQLKRLVYS